MNMKKALPILVIASMMLSMIPAVFAVMTPTYSAITGNKGTTIKVLGDAGEVPAGTTVKLYWDTTTVESWDGTKGLLNSTTAKASGGYEVWFDVPAATNGAHYVWLKDANGDTVSQAFTVTTKVKNSPLTGLPLDTISGAFDGFSKSTGIALILTDALVGTPILIEVIGTPDGVKKVFEGTYAHGYIVPGSIVIGLNAVANAVDDSHGNLIDGGDAGNTVVDGTINYVTGEFMIEFAAAPPVTPIPMRTDYNYYAAGAAQFLLGKGTTNSAGASTVSWKVPEGVLNPHTYAFIALDGSGVTDSSTTFSVGPVITLSSTAGTVGSVVTINGRGFSDAGQVVQGDVTIDGKDCYITTDTPVKSTSGRIRFNVVIPQVSDTAEFTIDVASTAGDSTADYEVTALASVSVNPAYGPQASTVTVTGKNFPKIAGKDINVALGAVDLGTAVTLADGTFSKAFKVPAVADGKYVLTASTVLYNIADTVNFKVGTMNVILSNDQAVTGETLSITGNGFEPSGTWNATIEGKTIEDAGAVNADGTFASEFMVPQLPVGNYKVVVWDEVAEIKLEADLQITKTTTVTLGVPSAPVGFNVTLQGIGFSDSALAGVDFLLYNKTSTGAADFWWNLEVVDPMIGTILTHPAVETNSSGEFYGYWLITEDLSNGNYFLNVTDANDYAVTGIPFAISDSHIVCTPRKATFKVGDTLSFQIEHSFGNDPDQPIFGSVIKIYNPSGDLVFSGDPLESWTKTGLWYTAPYSSQNAGGNPMVLMEDAPLGTWSFKWIDTKGDTIKSGTFVVEASAEAVLAQQVTTLQTAVDGLKTDVAGIKTDVAGAKTSVDNLKTTVDGINTALTGVAGTAGDAKTAAANAAAAAKSAADAASGLTTLVYAAIGASLIAALAAIVALMQISRKIA